MVVLDLVIGSLFGAALGSFLGCAAYRLPRRVSLNGRSHCPSCGAQLRWYWNIPVASWLVLRGRSACCETPISISYLTFEAVACLVGAAAALLLGLYAVLGIVIVTMLLAAVASELRSR